MNNIFLMILLSSFMNANTYLAKIEPYKSYKIKAQVAGVVTFSNKENFFSYRRSKKNDDKDYGRCISIIIMT